MMYNEIEEEGDGGGVGNCSRGMLAEDTDTLSSVFATAINTTESTDTVPEY